MYKISNLYSFNIKSINYVADDKDKNVPCTGRIVIINRWSIIVVNSADNFVQRTTTYTITLSPLFLFSSTFTANKLYNR